MTDREITNMVTKARFNNNVMSIMYRKKWTDKKMVRRKIEPYEVKDGYVWGWDITSSLPRRKKTIKRWIIKRLINASIEQEKFKPRSF